MENDKWQKWFWIVLVTVFSSIIGAIILKRPIYYALWLALAITWLLAHKMGYGTRDIWKMVLAGIRQAGLVITVMTLVGGLIGVWMANGTVASMMYYGLKYLSGLNVVLASFLITSIISMVLGTSVGTASTVGVALIGIGRTLGVPLPLMAGAIVSGAFLGDRTSPMAGAANLTAIITQTSLTENIKFMTRTITIPYMLATLIYFILGRKYIGGVDTQLIDLLQSSFRIGIIPILSVLVLVALILMKVNIRISMVGGIVSGIIIAVLYQGMDLREITHSMLMGFHSPGLPIDSVLSGGGIISMKNVVIMLLSANAFNGIVEGIGMIKSITGRTFSSIKSQFELIVKTAGLSIVAAMVGCNQALSIIVPGRLLVSKYDELGVDKRLLARTIEDSGVMIAPLIPWNVNGMAIAVSLGVRVLDFAPLAFLCYFTTITTLLFAFVRHYFGKTPLVTQGVMYRKG